MRWIIPAALAVAGAAALWGSANGQPLDPDSCHQACRTEYAACSERCGRHDDPVECNGDCRDALESCEARCR